MLLGRLAVDTEYRGHGLGGALLGHFLKALEVAEVTGVRVLLVHAKGATAATFSARYGFEPSPIDELTMMLLVKDYDRVTDDRTAEPVPASSDRAVATESVAPI